MISIGDHLNIAKETARLIGMGVRIYPGEDTRDGKIDLVKSKKRTKRKRVFIFISFLIY